MKNRFRGRDEEGQDKREAADEKPWQEIVMAPLGEFIILELVRPPKIAGRLIEMPDRIADKFGILKVVAMGPSCPPIIIGGHQMGVGSQVFVGQHAGDHVMDQYSNKYIIVQPKEILAVMVPNPVPPPPESPEVPIPVGEAN